MQELIGKRWRAENGDAKTASTDRRMTNSQGMVGCWTEVAGRAQQY